MVHVLLLVQKSQFDILQTIFVVGIGTQAMLSTRAYPDAHIEHIVVGPGIYGGVS